MKMENPTKQFIPIKEDAVCKYMKKINLEKLYSSLVNMIYEVRVPGTIAQRARLSIDKMLAI
jgi:quinolinate synthase